MKLPRLDKTPRPAHTLLCVTLAETVRVDADAEGMPLGESVSRPFDCAVAAKLPEAVDMALAAGPKPGRKLWVLYEGLALHTLLAPTAQVAGMEDAQLEQALRFELDGNGVAVRADERMAIALVGSENAMNSYTLCLAPGGVLDGLRRAASKRGSVLAGLAHPGGLPSSLIGAADAWLRLEYWGDTVVGVAGLADGQHRWSVFRSGAQSAQFQRELGRWRKTLREPYAEESLAWRGGASDGLVRHDADWAAVGVWLDRADDRQRWLQAWLKEIVAGEGRAQWSLPMLRPPVFSLPEPAIMAIAGVLALAVCLGHYAWFSHQATVARAETEKLKKAEGDMKTQQEAIRKTEEERGKLEKISRLQDESRDAIPRVVRALKERHGRLLHEVAVHRPDQVVLERLNATREGAELEGVTLDSYQVDKMADMLAGPLAALGWRVEPPVRDDLKTFSGGGPWHFVVKLRDGGLDGFAANPPGADLDTQRSKEDGQGQPGLQPAGSEAKP